RGGAITTRTRRSCTHTRGSRFGLPTSSPATPPTPRRPLRAVSSKRTARCGGVAPGGGGKPGVLRGVAPGRGRRARPPGRRAPLRAAQELSGEAAPSREATLLGGERRERLMGAITRLGEADREAIACRYFLDLSEADTAAALGVRRGTVKSRLSRALERLRAE